MLRGKLDTIMSSGYVEGWAFDAAAPLKPLTVLVRAGGSEVASGMANRYRWDLADAGCGAGWCAFRLKLSEAAASLLEEPMSLHDASTGNEIVHAAPVPLGQDTESPLSSLDDVARSDPTLVHSIEQLRGCGTIFADFIDAAGVDAFVRYAYNYALGRQPDPTGLAFYSSALREASMTPYEVLKTFYDCDEFRSVPRLLLAPPEAGFAFRQR